MNPFKIISIPYPESIKKRKETLPSKRFSFLIEF